MLRDSLGIYHQKRLIGEAGSIIAETPDMHQLRSNVAHKWQGFTLLYAPGH